MAKIKAKKGDDTGELADLLLGGGSDTPSREAEILATAAARLADGRNNGKLGVALMQNLELWVAIKAIATASNGQLPGGLRDNLVNLADYIVATTRGFGDGRPTDDQVQALIDMNLKVAQGFLEGQAQSVIRERAYEIWQAEGSPTGKDQEHWYRARQEVLGA